MYSTKGEIMHREGQVRKGKETERITGTHQLESAQGGLSQERQRNQASDGHSLSGEGTGRIKSGKGKKLSEQ